MNGHSLFSASASERWLACPGSLALGQGRQGATSEYAAEGTLAHKVLTWALQQGVPAADFIGHTENVEGFELTVDEEMVACVQLTIDYVRDIAGDDGVVLVDQLVNYAGYLGVKHEDGWGTLDVMVLRGEELVGIDLKYGRGKLVKAEDNSQIKLYVLGALEAVQGLAGDFTKARLVIHQPRIHEAPSEWPTTVQALETWARGEARSKALSGYHALNLYRGLRNSDPDYGPADPEASQKEWEDTFLNPGEVQCQWCPAAAVCPKLREEVANLVGVSAASPQEFEDLSQARSVDETTDAEWLAAAVRALDMVENWCKQVGAEALRRLEANEPVPGHKLVRGKRGARAWLDPKVAEDYLTKTARLNTETAYTLKLISPTQAEKLTKGEAPKLGQRQWKKLQEQIVQPEGKLHIAPETDPRPAVQVKAETGDFEDLTQAPGQGGGDPLADIA